MFAILQFHDIEVVFLSLTNSDLALHLTSMWSLVYRDARMRVSILLFDSSYTTIQSFNLQLCQYSIDALVLCQAGILKGATYMHAYTVFH